MIFFFEVVEVEKKKEGVERKKNKKLTCAIFSSLFFFKTQSINRARATALELGINAVLNPILDEILGVGNGSPGMLRSCCSSISSRASSSRAAKLDAAAALVPAASAAASQGGRRPAPSAPAAVGGMLCVLNALARAAAEGGHAVPPELFRVSSADRLVVALAGGGGGGGGRGGEDDSDDDDESCCSDDEEEEVEENSTAPNNNAGNDDPAAAWHAWTRLLSALGAHQGHVAVALGPRAKATLAALHAPLASPLPLPSSSCSHAPGCCGCFASSAPSHLAPSTLKRSKKTGRPVLEVEAEWGCAASDTPALDAFAAAVACSGILDDDTESSSSSSSNSNNNLGGPCEIRVTWTFEKGAKERAFLSRAAAVRELFRRAGRELVGLPSVEEEEQVGSSSSNNNNSNSSSSNRPPPPPPPLFVFLPSAGRVWFSPSLSYSPGAAEGYRLAGWLAAQALASRAPLCLPLPDVLFERLCRGAAFSPSLEALAEFDAAAAGAVRAAAALDSPTFAALLEAERMPATTSRREFAARAARAALVDGVAWQFDALAAGFAKGADRAALLRWRLTPSDLAELVGGEGGAAAGATAELLARSMMEAGNFSRKDSSSSGVAERLQQLLGPPPPPPLPTLPPLRKAARPGAGDTDVLADARA